MLKYIGLFILLLGTTAFALGSPLSADKKRLEHISKIEYVSHSEKRSLDEVRRLEPSQWHVINEPNINIGFTKEHYWFRLTLQNVPPSDGPWILRSNYPLLDVIDLYLLRGSVVIQEFYLGDKLPFGTRPIDQPSFVFPLNITTNHQHIVYIHAYTAGSLQLSLSLQNETSFWRMIATENAKSAAFFAVVLSMIFYNFIIFMITREKGYLNYVLYLSSFTMLIASIKGWAYQYIWPNSPDIHQYSVVFLLSLTVFFASLFVSEFLRLKYISPNLNKLLRNLGKVALASAFASLYFPYGIMAPISGILVVISAIIAIIAITTEWLKNRHKETLLFIIAWSALLIGVVLYIGQKFGVFPVNPFTESAVEIGLVLEALLLSLGLAERINNERKARLEHQGKMLLIQRKTNQELDNKVRERTEELEVMNNQLKSILVTDSLTQIKNRYYFDKTFTGEYQRAHRDKSTISLLILDIDHFKKINDNYGHQAGDEVLRVTAGAMQSIVNRPGDTAARYGGEEFAILLPSTPKQGACEIAERIRQHIESIVIPWEDKKITITISIGVASCIPDTAKGEDSLLKQADDFLYMAKNNGRNQVVYEDINQ